ncbi:hypothetical protein ACFVYR_26635 [Streptomyces sp. NPDC058284]|uniref:hypothetical protein n=1 Tax=unclassified Streptomyces TaxID=2593676 RepID=UPI003666535C
MTESQSPADDGLAVALKRAAESGGRSASPVPAGQVAARGVRRRRRMYAAGAAVAVCLVSGGAAAVASQLGQEGESVGPAGPVRPTTSVSSPGASAGRSSSPPTPSSSPSTSPSTSAPSATVSGG